jgi:hypothetical protein
MQTEDFIERVRTEGERVVSRPAKSAATAARAGQPGGIMLADLLAQHGPGAGRRDVHYRHILGPPASEARIGTWQQRTPNQRLPDDLVALIRTMNGIHLWADGDSGRAYTGLAPNEEGEPARTKFFGPDADQTLHHDRYIAISYHQDAAAFNVLDVDSGTYFLMDSAGPDTTTPIATNADELLDWLWQKRIAPK